MKMLGAILLCAIEPTVAQPSPAAVRRGVIFVRVHCSQCHAIGKVGASRLKNAAPFREMRLRYPVADLQRPLLEGIHPTMPRFQLTPSPYHASLGTFLHVKRSDACRCSVWGDRCEATRDAAR